MSFSYSPTVFQCINWSVSFINYSISKKGCCARAAFAPDDPMQTRLFRVIKAGFRGGNSPYIYVYI